MSTQPIIEAPTTRPYIEVLLPGPQGSPGADGAEFLVHASGGYPARASTTRRVVFVGPVDPGGLLLEGDAWISTSGSSPVTSVNTKTGAVALTYTDVGALPDNYVPYWENIINRPDITTLLAAKLNNSDAPELIRDTLGAALVAGTGMTVTVNDVDDTITLASTGGTGGGAVDSVNGFTGAVTLAAGDVDAVPTSRTVAGHPLTGNITIAKGDVGLSNVDNTADSTKAVLSATKLATARTINGVSFDGSANVTLPPSAAAFVMAGNVPGDLTENDLVTGGISIPVAVALDKMLFTLDQEPRGSAAVISVVKRTRTTGVETTIGTATIASGARRTTLTSLATSLVADDRVMLRCTQVGTTAPGTGLSWTMSDAAGTSFPTALAAPAAPTGATAAASGADVAVSWTAPASGSYYGVDIWKDGTFLTRILRGTTSYLDVAAADESHSYTLYAVNTDATSAGAAANFTIAAGIGSPERVGQGITNATNDAVTITATVPVSAGDMIVLMGAGTVPTGLTEVWTVTDSRFNTWTTHAHAYDNTSSQQSWIASSRVTTNIQAGDTITCTGTNATARLAVVAYSVSGIAAASRTDKSQTNVSATATRNMTTNATTALSQANEIAFSCFSALASSAPVVAGSGWSIGTTVNTTAATNDRMLVPQWRVTSATTAVTGTATLNTSSIYAGTVVTFKGA